MDHATLGKLIETLEKINIEELKKFNPKLTIWVEQENGKAIKL